MNQKEYNEWKERNAWKKWRWEFMRDSDEFKTDYERVLELRKRAKYPPDYKEEKGNVIEYPYWKTPEGQKEREYCAKYDLQTTSMPDPAKSFDELVGEEPVWDSRKETYVFTAQQAWAHFWVKQFDPKAVRFWHPAKETGRVRIEVDFNKVKSIESLTDHVSKLLRKHFKTIDRKQTKKVDYEKILMAGRLKKEKDETYNSIAARLYLDRYRKNDKATAKKIGDMLQQYDAFIKGGYRNITFP